MVVSPPKIYSEETVVDALLELMSGCSTCRVAVAYCGKEAYCFFPQKPEKWPLDLRIMIDASETAVRRGLTNPDGIETLLRLTDNVKSLEGLHAKVWVFDDRAALVGSVNLSESSIKQQFQLAVKITHQAVVREIGTWFDELWDQNEATLLDAARVRELAKLKPPNGEIQFKSRTRGKLPKPKRPPEPLPTIGVTPAKIGRLLKQFRNNVCPYHPSDGESCFQWAQQTEKNYVALGQELRSLMRHKSSWGKDQLAKIFEIAYTNGRHANIVKPKFVRQRPAQVAKSLKFMLQDAGDPYVRFEKVLDPSSDYKLAGMGAAGLKFLMHLWAPTEFAVVNGPVEKALRKLNVHLPSSHRAGQVFKDQTAAVKRIAELSNLTLAPVDHFLDAIGKDHIR